MECRAFAEGDHAIAIAAMEIHLLLCILVTALFSLDLYTRFCIGLNVAANSAYVFKFLGKRTEFFTGIALFFIFSLGLIKFKVLIFGFESKDFRQFLSDLRNGFRLNCKNCNVMAVIERPDSSESEELFPEQQLFDEISLRELVKSERQRANLAIVELEKERAAAATAAEEAMSMILKLQREKGSIEIESNNHRRLAEQKQQYDQQVIEFLRSVVMEQARERDTLESELRLCRGRMKHCSHCQSSDEFEEHEEEDCSGSAMEERLLGEEEDELISSLEFDSWVL